jgi:hypothetical protein
MQESLRLEAKALEQRDRPRLIDRHLGDDLLQARSQRQRERFL